MVSIKFRDKEKINTLLNIDSVFGEYQGRTLPVLLTIALAGAPLLVWVFFLQATFVKFWWVLIFDLFWSGRWALILIGKEKEKLAFWEQQRADEYKSADELIHVMHVHEDGLIEYENGMVSYIISAYPKGYLSDARFASDIEMFLNELDRWSCDTYLLNAIDEVLCQEELPKLRNYTDKQVIEERIEFYSYQDEWSRENSGLYRYVFLVSTAKYNWKKMKSHLEELVASSLAACFNEIYICDENNCMDVFNRDICGYVDVRKMILAKYDNEQYYGSKVMWWDDDIPPELIPEPDKSSLEERRVSD